MLSLVRKRRGNTQIQLEAIFGVDQTSIQYLQFADEILEGILPIAEKVARSIKNAKGKKLEELVPDKTVIIDGTHTYQYNARRTEDRKDHTLERKSAPPQTPHCRRLPPMPPHTPHPLYQAGICESSERRSALLRAVSWHMS